MSNNIIELNDVTFSYTTKILDIKNISIAKGEKVFIYGPSGSGKTTLLSILCGTLTPDTGKVSLVETNINSLKQSNKDHFRGNHIGHIFQQFNLINYLSVKENILLPTVINNKRKQYEAQNQEFDNICQGLGIADLLEKNVSELSVGQQQRVAVARAFIGGPEIIIADEPTSALDEDNKNKFIDELIKQSGDKTIIFVSHDKTLQKHFDRSINLMEINNL
jgi:putative ABC transport system ATP-binding protein